MYRDKFNEVYYKIIMESSGKNEFFAIAKETDGKYEFLCGYDWGYKYCLISNPRRLRICDKKNSKEDALRLLNELKQYVKDTVGSGKEPEWTDLQYDGDPEELNELKIVKVTLRPNLKIEEV